MSSTPPGSARGEVTFVGQLPPPIGGFSYISACVLKEFQRVHRVSVHNIAPVQGVVRISKHFSRLFRTLSACWDLATVKSLGSRVCYHPCDGGLGLIYSAAIVSAARLSDHKIILHHHSFQYIDRWKPLMRLLLWLSGDALHVFLCSIMRDRFEQTYNRITNSIVLSNAAFVELPTKSPPREDTRLVIGHLSNLTREKGLYRFLDLVREAAQLKLPVRAVLAGPVSSKLDQEAIEEAVSAFDGILEYRGAIYDADKVRFYEDIDVFVFPTEYVNEAQPTVLFEAMAAGCRIISFNRGCIANQFGEDHGLLIAQGQPFVTVATRWLSDLALDVQGARAMTASIAGDFAVRRNNALEVKERMLNYVTNVEPQRQ